MVWQGKDRLRNLVIVFGDQLSEDLKAFDGFDPQNDGVLMMEVEEEATYVPQHKIRIALFFAAMRYFANQLKGKGYKVLYSALDDGDNLGNLEKEITKWIQKTRPRGLICSLPGDYRVKETVERVAAKLNCRLEIRDDNHFLLSPQGFSDFAQGKKSLLLEHFYRHMRRRHRILMDGKKPVAGSQPPISPNHHGPKRDGMNVLAIVSRLACARECTVIFAGLGVSPDILVTTGKGQDVYYTDGDPEQIRKRLEARQYDLYMVGNRAVAQVGKVLAGRLCARVRDGAGLWLNNTDQRQHGVELRRAVGAG